MGTETVSKKKKNSMARTGLQSMPDGTGKKKSSPTGTAVELTHNFSQIGVDVQSLLPQIQTKLTLGQPGDKYEREADRVAGQVLNMPNAKLNSTISSSGASHVQPKSMGSQNTSGSQSTLSNPTAKAISELQGGGQPLSESTRSFMEPRFGHDFSNVRVHLGAQASETAESVQANAFTLRNDIVFRSGQFNPHSSQGQRLLAHELTHVVQQTGAVQKQSSGEKSASDFSNSRPHVTNFKNDSDQIISREIINTAFIGRLLGKKVHFRKRNLGGGSSASGSISDEPVSPKDKVSSSGISNFLDLEFLHENAFFEGSIYTTNYGATGNLGFFGDGLNGEENGGEVRPDSSQYLNLYSERTSDYYEASSVARAINALEGDYKGNYGLLGNNCQDWADDVRDISQKI